VKSEHVVCVGKIFPLHGTLVTSAEAELVQPLAEFVTVTVYVPVALTVGVAVLPPETMPDPLQLKLVPVVVAAESVVEVPGHVIVPPVALAPGGVIFWSTRAVAVLVQPLAEFVTVNVYVPVALTHAVAVEPPETIPGPLQLKLVPELAPPERQTNVVVQVKVPPVALAPGGVMFASTRAEAELVQPLAELVTVTVYVPDALTVGVAVEPPETIPGPDQLKLVPDVVAPESEIDVVVQVNVPPVALAPGGVIV
jgi:hypothetical protein